MISTDKSILAAMEYLHTSKRMQYLFIDNKDNKYIKIQKERMRIRRLNNYYKKRYGELSV
jgi:hypothetical protein